MCLRKNKTKKSRKNTTRRMLCVNNVCINLSWDKVIEKYCVHIYMHHLLWSWFFFISNINFFSSLYMYTRLTFKCALNQHYHCRWCNWTLILYIYSKFIYSLFLCLLNVINVHTLSGWLRIIPTVRVLYVILG